MYGGSGGAGAGDDAFNSFLLEAKPTKPGAVKVSTPAKEEIDITPSLIFQVIKSLKCWCFTCWLILKSVGVLHAG